MVSPTSFDFIIDLALASELLTLSRSRLEFIEQLYPDISAALADHFKLIRKLQITNPDQPPTATPKIVNRSVHVDDNVTLESTSNNISRTITTKWISRLDRFDWDSWSTKREELLKDLDEHNIAILSFQDFPIQWQELPDAPNQLFYQGNKDLLYLGQNLTVVGSRNHSKYSEIVLSNVFRSLATSNFQIVSGLALGIDALAHTLALQANLICIGVIGSGLDDESFYPVANLGLKRQIIANDGLVLSEYAPGTKATVYSFPLRNRFLASLSPLTWVVEASLKSGSLITAKQALEYGNTVATTPASVLEAGFQGNLKLLREGAQIIVESEDVLGILNLEAQFNSTPTPLKVSFRSDAAAKIYQHLTQSPQTLQEIVTKTNIPISQLNSELTMLELDNFVISVGENYWIRAN